jgi:glycosyltransferase involved in cell wall biosynthesis
VSGDPNIEYIYGDYTQQELYDLYCKAHCLVNPNKGEGFGLIPREFAATGGISLTTNWGGTSEFLDLWGWPIDYDLEIADWIGIKNLQGKSLGQWAEPKLSSVRRMMRTSFENREKMLREAKTKSNFVDSFYDWEFFALNVYAIWEAITNGYTIRSSKIPT